MQTLHGFILSLNASILYFHGPSCLHFETLQLMNRDFDANPDPPFDFDHPMQFLIRVTVMRIHAESDPYPQHW
jgi:hypothetical protein